MIPNKKKTNIRSFFCFTLPKYYGVALSHPVVLANIPVFCKLELVSDTNASLRAAVIAKQGVKTLMTNVHVHRPVFIQRLAARHGKTALFAFGDDRCPVVVHNRGALAVPRLRKAFARGVVQTAGQQVAVGVVAETHVVVGVAVANITTLKVLLRTDGNTVGVLATEVFGFLGAEHNVRARANLQDEVVTVFALSEHRRVAGKLGPRFGGEARVPVVIHSAADAVAVKTEAGAVITHTTLTAHHKSGVASIKRRLNADHAAVAKVVAVVGVIVAAADFGLDVISLRGARKKSSGQ